MTAHEFPQHIGPARRHGGDRFVLEKALDIFGQCRRRWIPAVDIPLDGFHDHPLEVTFQPLPELLGRTPAAGGGGREVCSLQPPQARRGTGRIIFAKNALDLIVAVLEQLTGIKRRLAGQQFVKQDPQRVDVRARVDFEPAHLGLLRADVLWRTDELVESGVDRLVGQRLACGFGNPEVDDLGHGLVPVQCHQDVRRFEVAVNDPLLVSMLDGVANLHKQAQPLVWREPLFIAEPGDRHTPHQFHDEIGPSDLGGSRVEHPGDARMIHHRQGLALGLKAGDDLASVHARLDDLERHPTPNRLLLLRHIHRPETAFPDPLE